jgi:hypothetical protein
VFGFPSLWWLFFVWTEAIRGRHLPSVTVNELQALVVAPGFGLYLLLSREEPTKIVSLEKAKHLVQGLREHLVPASLGFPLDTWEAIRSNASLQLCLQKGHVRLAAAWVQILTVTESGSSREMAFVRLLG